MPIETFERRALLLKAEVTEGTDPVPVPGTDALQILNGKSGILSEKIERQIDRTYWGADPFVTTRIRGFIEGEFELVPSTGIGNSANPLAPLLLIAGFAQTLVAGPPARANYNVISASIPSATAYFYHSGILQKMTGCRASISGISYQVGQYPKLMGRIEGNLVSDDITEVALPAGLVYTAFGDPYPIKHNTSLMSINAINVEGYSLEMDLGIALGVAEHTEGMVSRIRDRKPTGTIKYYRPLKATIDPWLLWRNATKVPVVFQVDNGTKLAKVTALAQLEEPKQEDLDGDLCITQAFRCVPTSGDDEVIFAFGNLV